MDAKLLIIMKHSKGFPKIFQILICSRSVTLIPRCPRRKTGPCQSLFQILVLKTYKTLFKRHLNATFPAMILKHYCHEEVNHPIVSFADIHPLLRLG